MWPWQYRETVFSTTSRLCQCFVLQLEQKIFLQASLAAWSFIRPRGV